MEVKIISNEHELQELIPAWLTLSRRTGATPFQFPEWLIPWWKYFGSGEICSYTVFEENDLVFFAPLYIRSINTEIEKKLVFIGTGNSDYLDIISYRAEADKYLPGFFDFLLSLRNKYDVVDLLEVNEKSPLVNASIPPALKLIKTEAGLCHIVKLPSGYNEFLQTFSKKRVKNLKRMEKKLSEGGGFLFEHAGKDDVDTFLNESGGMNAIRWSNNGGGVLTDLKTRQFNSAAIKNFMSSSMAYLFRIRNGYNTIASEYILESSGTAYDYIHSNNPDYEKFSPGFLMRIKSVEHLIEKGIHTFDFLRGDEEYKKDWDTYTIRNYRISSEL
jgi:CelD/BcsL family acetyltransferase involved in cellulose biosynthesis